jgi:hypothetical protein
VYFLIGFRNRLVVLIDWAWNYWTFARHARVVAVADTPRTVADAVTDAVTGAVTGAAADPSTAPAPTDVRSQTPASAWPGTPTAGR